MKKDFVPFLVTESDGSRPTTESRTEVLAGSRTAIAFHPLTQAPAHTPTPPNAHGEPTMTFERDGDRVARIKIHCPCGHIFELACDYAEGALA
jgi:hypothetical protein